MKHMKRLASLVLALVMAFSMSTTAFADNDSSTATGKITINTPVSGQEYKIYQILSLEDKDKYKAVEAWKSFVEASTDYLSVDDNGYVNWVKNASAADFVNTALAYAKENSLAATATQTATSKDTPIVFDNLEPGYYLVQTSIGALCKVNASGSDASIHEKDAGHTHDKEVQEDSTSAWGDKNDASVGETVHFRATIQITGKAIDLVMHDTMDDGLTFSQVDKITLNEEETTQDTDEDDSNVVSTTSYEVVDYTQEGAVIPSDGCTFEVNFTTEFCDTLKSGDKIVVYYSAVLNDKAVVKEAEINKSHLSYKDEKGHTYNTKDDETKTYTWGIPVVKYGNGDESNFLSGAVFSLYTDEACTDANIVKFTKKTTSNTEENKDTDTNTDTQNVKEVYQVDPEGKETQITTNKSGSFDLEGLDEGTYYLKEITAPANYNVLKNPIKIVVDHDGKITASETEVTKVTINNNYGIELPDTGGMGTKVFYVVGGLLVAGAAVLLITRRRMRKDG